MFGDPEGESGHETRPLFELAKGGSERPVSTTHAARGGALSRSPIEAPARRIAPCRDPGRPGRERALWSVPEGSGTAVSFTFIGPS